MNLASRVKINRKHKGFSQEKLGELSGLSQQSINKIERGRSLNPRTLPKIAEALDCTPEYLQFGIVPEKESNVSFAPVFQNYLPLIDWVQAGAWTEIFDLEELKMELYQCPIDCSKRAFVLEVQGVSMEPEFLENEHIFVDPDESCSNGSYVVVLLKGNEKVTFKQLIIEDNKKYLKAINPDWPEQFIEINDCDKIIGKVIYKGKKL